MRKTVKLISLFLAILLTFSGCAQSRRMTNMTIAQALGIDEENGKIKVSIQYLNLSNNSGTVELLQGNITDTATGTGDNISEAVSAAARTLSREIFFGQNKVVVIGRDCAKSRLSEVLDYLLRSVDSRPDVLVALSADTAHSVIENPERGAKVPAENISNLLRTGEENGLGAAVTVNELLNIYSDDASDIFLPVLKSEKEFVSCSGIAAFSKGRYAFDLSSDESFGFLFVKNKVSAGSVSVNSEGLGITSLEIAQSRSKNSVISDGNALTFKCKIKVTFILNEIENGLSRELTEEDIKSLEAAADERVKSLAVSAINACYKNKSDPFMTSRYLSKSDMSLYNKMKDDWRNSLTDLTVSVEVESSIRRINSNSR